MFYCATQHIIILIIALIKNMLTIRGNSIVASTWLNVICTDDILSIATNETMAYAEAYLL